MNKKHYESEPKTCCVATVTSEKNLTLNNFYLSFKNFFAYLQRQGKKRKKVAKTTNHLLLGILKTLSFYRPTIFQPLNQMHLLTIM